MTRERKATSANRRVQRDEHEQTIEKRQARTKLKFCENEASSIKKTDTRTSAG
jgi:hypothetical protein